MKHNRTSFLSITLFQISFLLTTALAPQVFAQEHSAKSLDPFARAKWISAEEERNRNFQGLSFLGAGTVGVLAGVSIQAMTKKFSVAAPFYLLGAGAGLFGAYYLLSDNSFTRDLSDLEAISAGDEKKKQAGSEVLLESLAGDKKRQRYIAGFGSITGGLILGILPFALSSTNTAKTIGLVSGASAASAGVLTLLFPSKPERLWETYKSEKRMMSQKTETNSFAIAPMFFEDGDSVKPGVGFSLKF